MGKIAEGLIAAFRHELVEAAEQFTEDLPADMLSPEELFEEGYDPQYILYVAAQNFIGMFAESVCGTDLFQEYDAIIDHAEDRYEPSEPPDSPVTRSFFWTWAWCDVPFGPDQETIGGCVYEMMQVMQAPPDMLVALRNFSDSRMGIYEHLGQQADKIRLRELVTGDELLCHSASGYLGHREELWYVRLVPPLSDFDYHVTVTTPYVLQGTSTADWTQAMANLRFVVIAMPFSCLPRGLR